MFVWIIGIFFHSLMLRGTPMKTIAKCAFLTVAFAVAQLAQAQNSYVELSGGQAQVKKFCDGVVGTCDDNGTGFKVFIGHNFTANVGGEIGYVNFGNVKGTDNSLGFPVTAEAKAQAFGGSVVGILPFDALSLFGKAGAYYTHTSVDASALGISLSGSGNKFVPELGVGVRYMFNNQFGFRVEFERFFGLGDIDVSGGGVTAHLDKTDVDMFSAGVEFHF
jgi:OmpA-OmpF porin, OOP family